MQNPYSKIVSVGNTRVNLLTLLQAIDANCPTRCCELTIQWDDQAGANVLLIGGDDLTTVKYGRRLIATQAATYGPHESNILNLSQFYLLNSGAGPNNAIITATVR